ncbi:MAG: hypothetical protein LBT05_07200 [Planctomycetaceae bacterium]|jgi:enamine deaminase RidA (YjgF/YER057c/UK114 family)|nr:hypothetical protein [Planctomycetaceae bacterium]
MASEQDLNKSDGKSEKRFAFHRNFIKANGRGGAFSLIQRKSLRQMYLVAESFSEGNLETKFNEICNTLINVLDKQSMRDSVITMSVFLYDLTQKQFLRQNFIDFFGKNLPQITYIPQNSCFGKSIVVELFAIGSENQSFEIHRHSENSVEVLTDDLSVLFCGDVRPDEKPQKSYFRSLNAFQKLQTLLSRESYSISNLYRTWLYLGHIVDAEDETQRYKELNRARAVFFNSQNFIADFLPQSHQGIAFPASTGIGADDYDVVMSSQAIRSERKNLILVPLENPLQVSAFDYGQVYSPQSPKFSRAMAFVDGNDAKVYISGTASITDSESRFRNDPEHQTHQTLDNIAALVTKENLSKHGVNGFHATLEQLAVARVYVKNPSDFPMIQRVCEERIYGTPIVYVFADVCRPELLVEIEGIIIPEKTS